MPSACAPITLRSQRGTVTNGQDPHGLPSPTSPMHRCIDASMIPPALTTRHGDKRRAPSTEHPTRCIAACELSTPSRSVHRPIAGEGWSVNDVTIIYNAFSGDITSLTGGGGSVGPQAHLRHTRSQSRAPRPARRPDPRPAAPPRRCHFPPGFLATQADHLENTPCHSDSASSMYSTAESTKVGTPSTSTTIVPT